MPGDTALLITEPDLITRHSDSAWGWLPIITNIAPRDPGSTSRHSVA
jgi:hypothetical protein